MAYYFRVPIVLDSDTNELVFIEERKKLRIRKYSIIEERIELEKKIECIEKRISSISKSLSKIDSDLKDEEQRLRAIGNNFFNNEALNF